MFLRFGVAVRLLAALLGPDWAGLSRSQARLGVRLFYLGALPVHPWWNALNAPIVLSGWLLNPGC